jgi:hypothetical protein
MVFRRWRPLPGLPGGYGDPDCILSELLTLSFEDGCLNYARLSRCERETTSGEEV